MKPAEYAIRAEHSGDEHSIRAVHVAAFPTSAEADLVDRLRANGRLVVSLVAEVGDEVVGHVAFSPVTIDSPIANASGLGLAPVAVAPSHQRIGIAAALIRHGLDECRNTDLAYIVVLGAPAYYRRFGFEPAGAKGLDNEYGAHDEFMVLELKPGSLGTCRGLVRYSPEFAELS